jgi:hypothetical protein
MVQSNNYVGLNFVILMEAIPLCLGTTHNTLKSFPTLPRKQQTTIRCNGYQML